MDIATAEKVYHQWIKKVKKTRSRHFEIASNARKNGIELPSAALAKPDPIIKSAAAKGPKAVYKAWMEKVTADRKRINDRLLANPLKMPRQSIFFDYEVSVRLRGSVWATTCTDLLGSERRRRGRSTSRIATSALLSHHTSAHQGHPSQRSKEAVSRGQPLISKLSR